MWVFRMIETTFTIPVDTTTAAMPGEFAKKLRLAALATPEHGFVSINIGMPSAAAREIARRIDVAARPAPRPKPQSTWAHPDWPALPWVLLGVLLPWASWGAVHWLQRLGVI